MISISDINEKTAFLGTETLKISNDLHKYSDEIGRIARMVQVTFGDQLIGQQIFAELSEGVRNTTNAAYEIGQFNIKAQQIIMQLSQ
jgi:hypothetical protein